MTVNPNYTGTDFEVEAIYKIPFHKKMEFIELETLSCKRKAGLLSLCQV